MSFATRSKPLETISEAKLEAVQTADELYYMTAELYNPNTETYQVYDFNLSSNTIFTIKSISSGTILYITDEAGTESTAVTNGTEGNITYTDAGNGKFTVEIPNAVTEIIALGNHGYDVFTIQTAGSKRKPLLRGEILFVDNATP